MYSPQNAEEEISKMICASEEYLTQIERDLELLKELITSSETLWEE